MQIGLQIPDFTQAGGAATARRRALRAAMVDQLGGLAEMGIDAAIGSVVNVWDITPLEIIGREVIPAVARL
jgi:hypothetical protein